MNALPVSFSLARSLRSTLSLLAAAALVANALACGGATTTSHAGGSDAGDDGQQHQGPSQDGEISCGAIGIVPPTVTVRNAANGALICDPIIIIVSDASAVDAGEGDGYPCGPHYGGCPSAPPDGGPLSCVFTVGQLEGTATIEVSAVGYISKIVPNVSSGVTGCVETPTSGTQVNVSLEPAPQHPTPAPPDAG